MKYFQASQMEYDKKPPHTDQRKSHKYSKSSIPYTVQKSQFISDKRSPAPEAVPKKIYSSGTTTSANKTNKNHSTLHKKSASTIQGGGGYSGVGKASEMLAHITAKYGVSYLKTEMKKEAISKPPSNTILPESSELQTTLRELLRHDPSITVEPTLNTTTKPTTCTHTKSNRPPPTKGLGHKRAKSDQILCYAKQSSPVPAATLKNNYVGVPPKGDFAYKRALKLIYNPQEEIGPQQILSSQFYHPDPSIAPLAYSSNTTITNNTNIILVGNGNKPYKINTSGHSPREFIQPKPHAPTKTTGNSQSRKPSTNTSSFPNRILIKKMLNKFSKDKSGNTTMAPGTLKTKPSFIEEPQHSVIKADTRPPSEASTIYHHGSVKRPISGAHTHTHSKEQNRTITTVQKLKAEELHKRYKSGMTLADYKKKEPSKNYTRPSSKNHHDQPSELKRYPPTAKRQTETSTIKGSIVSAHRKNARSEIPSSDSSSADIGGGPINKGKKNSVLAEKPKTKVDLMAKFGINLPSNAVKRVEPPKLAELAKELKLDPKREKEMIELAEFIKKYWGEARKAPKTEVKFYKIGKMLGKGAFGKVSLGIHKLTGKFVAVKSISKQVMTDETSKNKVMREVSIWEQLQHPSVIRLYETFESAKHLLYVEELCAGGDLLTYVRKRRKLKENVAKVVLKQILDGLYYCHSKSILHRDIKLDNILLDADGMIKICDFGVSKVVKKGERMTEQCGTPAYIAPEILRDKGYEGFAVDIWSAGVVLFAMIYGTVPFKANNMSELHKMIIKGKYTLKTCASEDVRDLLRKMLEPDPKKRFTIPQILCHKWFSDYDPTVSLFTTEEKENIRKEFTYSQRMNRNQTQLDCGPINTVESDWFTEQNIDSSQSDLTRNITTKSVILAPFNSTRTHQSDMHESVRELLVDKKAIKLCSKVRDIDRQYEKNNNCEVDNGVYNKFAYDTESKGGDTSQLNPLASNEESFEEERKEDNEEEKMGILTASEMKKREETSKAVQEMLLNSLMPKPLAISKEVARKVWRLGYPEEYLVPCLEQGVRNYATTTYYLLSKQ